MNLKKIKSLRTYQAVKFENKLDTFFTSEGTPNRLAVEMEILEGVGVAVKSDKDCVIVPFPNISGIYMNTQYHEDEKKRKQEQKKAELKGASLPKIAKVKKDPLGAKRL